MYEELVVEFHAFLAFALDGGKWSRTCFIHFTPREGAPSTHWIGGWVGQKLVWMWWQKENNPCPLQESNSRHPAHSHHYIDRTTLPLNIDRTATNRQHLSMTVH